MQTLTEAVDRFVRENKAAIIEDIGRLVAVPSVEGDPEPEAPWGPGPREALDTALTIAEELGLQTVNLEGHIGYAVLGGSGAPYLATITHVDTVPAGNGWNTDPFRLTQREGVLLGRGVVDDKGPSVLCLYALKCLKELGLSLKYPIRAILGANEETNMGDIPYYKAREPEPLFLFSPDAEFPLICGEKGIWHGRLVSAAKLERLVDFKGGTAINAVPDRAECFLHADRPLSGGGGVSVRPVLGAWQLSAKGVAGHASTPQGTVNAIGLLTDYLLEQDLVGPRERAFLQLTSRIHHASDGSLLGLAGGGEHFSPLTVVGGMTYVEEDRLVQTLDIRYPDTLSGEKISKLLEQAAGAAATVECIADRSGYYHGPDTPQVRALLAALQEVTGKAEEPVTIGGGTYAREFDNAVAFGPVETERSLPDFAGPIHGANEGITEEELSVALRVIILALIHLEKEL